MTSSYNLSRRPLEQLLSPINWDAYQRQFGLCYGGYITVPITQGGGGTIEDGNSKSNCSDWKFCVPIKNSEGMPASYPEVKDFIPDHGVNETRHFTNNLYRNPNIPCQSRTNMYPPHTRRVERRKLDKEDYFRLPVAFDGTGYHPTRSWAYPEYATDHVEIPDEWSPFHLIQRKDLQQQAKRESIQREEQGFGPYIKPYLGTFYKDF